MEKQIKELIDSYTTIRNQSQLMIGAVSDNKDVIKLETSIVTFNMVIDDLEEIVFEDRK